VRKSLLGPPLRRVRPTDAQNQFYLTDLVEVLHDGRARDPGVMLDDPAEAQGGSTTACSWPRPKPCCARGINEALDEARGHYVGPDHTYIDADGRWLGPESRCFPGCVRRGTGVSKGAPDRPSRHLSDVYVGGTRRSGMVDAINAHVGADARCTPSWS